jgi:hypothetical protein
MENVYSKEKFVKLHQFDWDYAQLIDEFLSVKALAIPPLQGYHLLNINYSDIDSEHTPCHLHLSAENKHLLKGNNDAFYRTYKSTNIRRPWRMKPHTLKAVNDIRNALLPLGLDAAHIRYYYMPKQFVIGAHSDVHERMDDVNWDYEICHIPFKTNDNTFVVIDKEIFFMHDLGGVYKIRQDLNHTAANADGFEDRIQLSFKIVKATS